MAYFTLLLLATLKMSTRDFSWGKGSRCIRLMTYHPRSAERQENPGPYPTRNPLGHLGLFWETFTFTFTLPAKVEVTCCYE